MIISINATVCAAADHGEDWQHKIVRNDRRKTVQERRARGIDQGCKKVRTCSRIDGSWSRITVDGLRPTITAAVVRDRGVVAAGQGEWPRRGAAAAIMMGL